ncbi:hypothetical protein Tco_0278293 [Tanacetum coccineum]
MSCLSVFVDILVQTKWLMKCSKTPAPIRSDEQILPFDAWVPIGKSNFVLDLHKKKKNPIFQIFVDILQNINFFRAFTASAFVLAIYIQHPTKKGRKDKPHVIPYCWFTKLIICHLGIIHNIHQRSTSPFHLAEEDFRLGMHRTTMLIWKLCLPEKHDQKVQPKRKERRRQQLVDEPDEEPAQPEPEPEPEQEGEEYDMEHAIQMSLESFHSGTGSKYLLEMWQFNNRFAEAIRPNSQRSKHHRPVKFHRWTPATEEASTVPSAQPHDDTSANIVCDSPSSVDAETGAGSDKTNSRGDTEVLHVTPPNLGSSGMLNIRGRYFIDQ